MRVRITNPNGQVVEVEGTRAEVEEYMRRNGGHGAQPRHLPRQQHQFAGYEAEPEVLEGVVVESTPSTALQATPQGPATLVDERELSRYFRGAW